MPEKEAAREALTWWGVMGVAMIAVLGGSVRYVQVAWKNEISFSFRKWCLDTVPALLVGFIVGSACKGLGWDAGIAGALGGLLGHQASRALGVASNNVIKRLRGQ